MNPNAVAKLFDYGIIIAFYLAKKTASKWRFAYWLFIPPACLGVMLTGSRAGFYALISSLSTIILFSDRRRLKSVLILFLILGIGALMAARFVPSALMGRLGEGTGASSFADREDLWRYGLEAWSENPIIGVGAGAYGAIAGSVAHNTFIEILVCNGLVGMAIMSIVWGLLVRSVLRMPLKERGLWLGAVVLWIAIALAGSQEYSKTTWILYGWILIQSTISSKLYGYREPHTRHRSPDRQPISEGEFPV